MSKKGTLTRKDTGNVDFTQDGTVNLSYVHEDPDVNYSVVPISYTKAPFKSLTIETEPGGGNWNNNTIISKSDKKDEVCSSSEEESSKKDNWDNPIEFMFSCISMSVGLGNVWRFPFVAYANGGGAFLIPYFIVLIVIGRPLYYLEMCVGQFVSEGSVKIWNMAPLFKGVGYGSAVAVICILSYYCSIMAQTVYYFVASFSHILPWSTCQVEWGGDLCLQNGTVNASLTSKSASALYYEEVVFPRIPNIDEGLGSPEWRLSLCLMVSWAVIFLSLIKGVKSSGKVAYFTALFPYGVLITLLVRGVTLPGAWDGILYFINPQWDKIWEPQVWYAAVSQCFFSLATGMGPIVMLASHNKFNHNINRDALIISFTDTFTSLLAGCTIFSVLGYISNQTGQHISEVAKGGPGLAFVSYPEAIAQFGIGYIPQIFAVLFFLMLFTLGIGSATPLASGIVTIICDQFPKLVRWKVTLGMCVFGFVTGLMYVTPGGEHMLNLIDHFGGNFIVYVMGMVEVGAISWVYGLNNLCTDIEFMLKRKVSLYWKVCWGFFIPVGLAAILVYYVVTAKELTSEGVPFPTIAIVSGNVLSGFAISLIPLWGIHAILTRKADTFKDKLLLSFKPNSSWGPKSPKIRQEWMDFKRLN